MVTNDEIDVFDFSLFNVGIFLIVGDLVSDISQHFLFLQLLKTIFSYLNVIQIRYKNVNGKLSETISMGIFDSVPLVSLMLIHSLCLEHKYANS